MLIVQTSLALILPIAITLIWRITRQALYRSKAAHRKPSDPNTSLQEPAIRDALSNPIVQNIAHLAQDSHQRAKEAQRKYQDVISLAIGCVFCAFLIFSLEVSVEHHDKIATKLAYTYETTLLLCSIALFKLSRRKMKTWMTERATAELRRQRYFVTVLLSAASQLQPKVSSGDLPLELPSWPNLEGYEGVHISQKVQELTVAIRQPLFAISIDSEVSAPVSAWYRDTRIQRQVDWFHSAENRLELFLTVREKLLFSAFIVATLSGATKALYYWTGLVPAFEVIGPALTFISQVSLAITAGLAAFLLSQNTQYLIQRYRKQLASIETNPKLISPPKSDVVEEVIWFETLIGDELVDFISQFESFNPEISL